MPALTQVQLRPSRAEPGDQGCNLLGRVALQPRDRVRVGVERDGDRAVTEPFGHDLTGLPFRLAKRGLVRVARQSTYRPFRKPDDLGTSPRQALAPFRSWPRVTKWTSSSRPTSQTRGDYKCRRAVVPAAAPGGVVALAITGHILSFQSASGSSTPCCSERASRWSPAGSSRSRAPGTPPCWAADTRGWTAASRRSPHRSRPSRARSVLRKGSGTFGR